MQLTKHSYELQSGPLPSSIFMTIILHTVSVGGMVMFWATLHTPVHAAMLGQSGESSKTNPPGVQNRTIICIHNYNSQLHEL